MNETYFISVANWLRSLVRPGEFFTCWLSSEESDFVRLNQGQIRQAGQVSQQMLAIDWMEGQKHIQGTLSLSGHLDTDCALIGQYLEQVRQQLRFVREDPFLLYSTEVQSSQIKQPDALPQTEEAIGLLLQQTKGLDLVGLYAAGRIDKGFSNALGQHNWMSSHSFHLDFSLYAHQDKAVKSAYAGSTWDPTALFQCIEKAKTELELLKMPPERIAPGEYRVYLAPAALFEIFGLLNWGSFGEKAFRTKASALQRMRDEQIALSPLFTLSESTSKGLGPNFQMNGFVKPDQVNCIVHGQWYNAMVSPRTAKEFGIPTNGANPSESLESIEVAAGSLPKEKALEALGTGVWVNNLWYLNFSDRALGRMTGMTRFATFWVENGQIKAPLDVMRFDDSIFRLFGTHLEQLTQERDWIIDAHTYDERSTQTALLPGALIKRLKLTL